MPHIQLTNFVDIVGKVGTTKITEIARVKKQQAAGYHPSKDFYKIVREHIIDLHQSNAQRSQLQTAQQLTTNLKKISAYTAILAGYRSFWGRKQITWFDPPRRTWTHNTVDVNVNPELGLMINGVPNVIKLYFKTDPLGQTKVSLILFLMHQTLPPAHQGQNIIYSILDTRRNNLLSPTAFNVHSLSALNAEAAYIDTIWPSL